MKNNHAYAAEMISLILQHEKGMTAQFCTMTDEYIQGLRFPELVRDSRGHECSPATGTSSSPVRTAISISSMLPLTASLPCARKSSTSSRASERPQNI